MNDFDDVQSDELPGCADYEDWVEYQARMAAESEFEYEDYDDNYDSLVTIHQLLLRLLEIFRM